MKKTVISILGMVLFFNACEDKSIDENIIAKTNIQKEIYQKFEQKNYSLTTIDAKIIDFKNTEKGLEFKDYKGKKAVLVDVFATWCPPCIKEIPVLNELREKYKNDFEIVSVLFEKNKPIDEMVNFIDKYKIKYPVTIGDDNFVLTKDLGDIKKVPEMFLFSKEGEFINRFIGTTSKEELERYIKVAIEN